MTADKSERTDVITSLLHDCVAPQLFISQKQLELFIDSLEEDALSDTQHKMLVKSWQALRDGQTTLREIMTGTSAPDTKSEAAFYPTVAEVIATYKPLIRLEIHTDKPDPESPPPMIDNPLLDDTLLGICLTEFLANVYKHAPTLTADIYLKRNGAKKILEVHSPGKPDDTAHIAAGKKSSLGWRILNNRVARYGGRAAFSHKKGRNIARVTFPLNTMTDKKP